MIHTFKSNTVLSKTEQFLVVDSGSSTPSLHILSREKHSSKRGNEKVSKSKNAGQYVKRRTVVRVRKKACA